MYNNCSQFQFDCKSTNIKNIRARIRSIPISSHIFIECKFLPLLLLIFFTTNLISNFLRPSFSRPTYHDKFLSSIYWKFMGIGGEGRKNQKSLRFLEKTTALLARLRYYQSAFVTLAVSNNKHNFNKLRNSALFVMVHFVCTRLPFLRVRYTVSDISVFSTRSLSLFLFLC